MAQRMFIVQLYDHQGNVPVCMVSLLLLDMWEHAYYLQYRNEKAEFVKQWWNIVNWADVGQRYQRAKHQTQGLVVP